MDVAHKDLSVVETIASVFVDAALKDLSAVETSVSAVLNNASALVGPVNVTKNVNVPTASA